MEREVGGGIGMRNTCKPMAVSFQRMTKFTTNKKKKLKKKSKKQNKTKRISGKQKKLMTIHFIISAFLLSWNDFMKMFMYFLEILYYIVLINQGICFTEIITYKQCKALSKRKINKYLQNRNLM